MRSFIIALIVSFLICPVFAEEEVFRAPDNDEMAWRWDARYMSFSTSACGLRTRPCCRRKRPGPNRGQAHHEKKRTRHERSLALHRHAPCQGLRDLPARRPVACPKVRCERRSASSPIHSPPSRRAGFISHHVIP